MNYWKPKISTIQKLNFLSSVIEKIPNGGSFLRINSEMDLVCSLKDAEFKAEVISRDTKADNNVLFWNIDSRNFYGMRETNRDIFGKDSAKLLSVISEILEYRTKKRNLQNQKELAKETFRKYLIENVNSDILPDDFENDIRQNENVYSLKMFKDSYYLEIKYNSNDNSVSSGISSRGKSELVNLEKERDFKIREFENAIQHLRLEYNQKMIESQNIFKKVG